MKCKKDNDMERLILNGIVGLFDRWKRPKGKA